VKKDPKKRKKSRQKNTIFVDAFSKIVIE